MMLKQKTGSTNKKVFTKLSRLKKSQMLIIFVVIFAFIGCIILLVVHASNPTASIEPELGGVSCPAVTGSDSTASGSSYVQFKSMSCGGNFEPLVGSFVGAKTDAPMCSIYCTSKQVESTTLPNRSIGLDMMNDTGEGGDNWFDVTNPLAWTNDTNDNGGNSNIQGNKEFINSRANRGVVMSFFMYPYNLDGPVTFGGTTTSSCPQDPNSDATKLNQDKACMLAGAAGQFNAHWANLARILNNYGLNTPKLILRIGWECSGNWYPWSAFVAGEANYVSYYRNIVTSMRGAVSNPQFKFAWDCGTGTDWGNGGSQNDGHFSSDAYPGNAFVDYLDFDPYDNGNGGLGASGNDWDANTVNSDHGLAFWANFASQNNKYLGFTEWGVANDNDPNYIQEVHDFVYNKSNRVAYALYENFDTSTSSGNGQNFNINAHPNSFAAYKRLFGSAPEGVLPNF